MNGSKSNYIAACRLVLDTAVQVVEVFVTLPSVLKNISAVETKPRFVASV